MPLQESERGENNHVIGNYIATLSRAHRILIWKIRQKPKITENANSSVIKEQNNESSHVSDLATFCFQIFRGAPQLGQDVAVSGMTPAQYSHGIMATSFSFTTVGPPAGLIT